MSAAISPFSKASKSNALAALLLDAMKIAPAAIVGARLFKKFLREDDIDSDVV